MIFVAQFNLAELASAGTELDLPKSGQMYFFFDPGWYRSRGPSACVFSLNASELELEPAEFPEDVLEHHRMPGSAVEIAPMSHLASSLLLVNGFRSWATGEERAMFDEYKQVLLQFREPRHHLGGAATHTQDEVEIDLEIRSRRMAGRIRWDADGPQLYTDKMYLASRKNWRCLLQIDTDERAGLIWGDMGTLFFGIKTEDWKRGDFSKVEAGMQCS